MVVDEAWIMMQHEDAASFLFSIAKRCRKYYMGLTTITQDIADKALTSIGIDNKGLDAIDRKLLFTIMDSYKGGPVGLDALAATLNEESDTIADTLEPYLLKAGFLRRTSRGREATKLAYEHIDIQSASKQKELF